MNFCVDCKYYNFAGHCQNGMGQYGMCTQGGNKVRWNDYTCNKFIPEREKKRYEAISGDK